jgi:predicted Zn finger-like uncharacterized protein
MATDVDCPSCDQKLRVPDELLGKKVKCPSCKTMFKATISGLKASAPSPPVDEEEEVPSRHASGLSPSKRANVPSKRPAPPEDEDEEEEDEDDDRPRQRSGRRPIRRRSRDLAPHRGTLILVFGILGLLVAPLIFGPIAWIMGNNDIKEIQAGRMDPEGESQTNIGRILGMISTILGIVGILVACVFFVIWLIVVIGMFGAAAGASGH